MRISTALAVLGIRDLIAEAAEIVKGQVHQHDMLASPSGLSVIIRHLLIRLIIARSLKYP